MEGVATLMSMELSGIVFSLTDPNINVLWSSEIRNADEKRNYIVILFRKPVVCPVCINKV